MENYSFDLQRIFFGEAPPLFLLEIMLRTAVMFGYTLAILRLVGARAPGQLSLFELMIVVALGSAVGDPMFYADVPLIYGMLVITLIIIFQRAIVTLTNRHPKVEQMVEGRIHRLVIDGRLDESGISRSTLSKQEVLMELRHEGVEFLEQVRRAYLEMDGHVSVFMVDDLSEITRKRTPILPEEIGTDISAL